MMPPASQPPRPQTRRGVASVLVILATLLFGAGISKLGLGVAAVIAAETAASGLAEAGDPRDTTQPEPDPRDLLAALRARAARLNELEQSIELRRQALSDAEASLGAQLQALDDAEARLEARLRFSETAANEDLASLTNVYEHMKPADAAALFSQMDVEFAAGFMARLRPDFAGQVMSAIDPLTAYAISAVLAGRHANAPRE